MQGKETNTNTQNTAEDKEVDNADKELASTLEAFVDPSVEIYKKKKKQAKAITIIAASALLLIYGIGVLISSMFFYDNTVINGIDVSGKKLSDAEKLITEDMSGYGLEIAYSDTTQKLCRGDGGLTFLLDESMKDVKLKQQPWLWFLHFGKKYAYDVKYKPVYDKDELTQYIMSYPEMISENMTAATDAYVDMSSGEAVVVPDELGTMLDTEKTCDVILNALNDNMTSVNIYESGCYIEAKVKEDDTVIKRAEEEAKKYLDIKAKYDFGDYVMTIPKEDLATMAYIDELGNVKISKAGVYAYAAKFTDKYTTCQTVRKFKTHDGQLIGVYGENYGWKIDGEREADELYNYMCGMKDFTKEPAYTKKGYSMGEMNDLGKTYIEIDLTNQHLYFYENGRLILDNDIVSGWLNNPNNYKTPGGLFAMDNKAYKVILRGVNYATPVTYWMGFNGGIGIHDATWRSEFGGDIYVNNGSHGCINLPIDFAALVYEHADPGMPVICYWLDEVEHYDE